MLFLILLVLMVRYLFPDGSRTKMEWPEGLLSILLDRVCLHVLRVQLWDLLCSLHHLRHVSSVVSHAVFHHAALAEDDLYGPSVKGFQ